MAKEIQYSGCTISEDPCICFEQLSKKEQKFLDENTVKIKYKKGEIICKQGSYASHIMSVESGLVKVYIDDGINSLVLKMIPEGSLLGLSSVNEEYTTFQYSATSYIDTVVNQINIVAFRKLLNKNPGFAKSVIDILNAKSVQINSRFFCLTHKQSYGRLADIILCLADRVFKKREFDLPLSRKDLAELSTMSAETVIRMLKKFKEDDLIVMDGKKLKIVDYDRLKRISETG
ncbi:MAG: Crp/Fnr family transcriptional regulator [Bacteroidales bacterium]|jgi:CRP-like cAMP-binding protein|nr:Crp/Fnr family transcriptional regulator [Bacteroidales bacterium]